jgi:hypothetical protein
VKLNVTALAVSLVLASSAALAANEKPSADVVARGKLLVTIGGCHDCHTPKNFGPAGMEPDMTRQLSGHPATSKLPAVDKQALKPGYWYLAGPELTAWVGPWGISFAMNLTPDEQTGLGLWTEEIFISALRNGKHMGAGRPILPPMPWQYVRELPDSDLKAVWAYLRSIPPIKNVVPQPVAPADVANAK